MRLRVSGDPVQSRNKRGRTFRRLYNLKLKAEACGYPGWVDSTEHEDRYVESFWQSEGIRLEKEAIRCNAAKRGLAKLCLNSMWG